ncbi:MAG: HypC/HybG/HupF family hydrogenase formation chaperone [Bacillota bacterium]|nr:HypC/HybG/HupF family hydrogenase formation chaperone [Bacillota bacterium]
MCLAVPLKILILKDNEAVAELNGIKRNIRTDLIKDLNVGDYVLVHAGFAIEKLREETAIDTLKAIQELDEAMKEV